MKSDRRCVNNGTGQTVVGIEKMRVLSKVIKLGNRVAPAKARESCIVSISGDPFGPKFYSECSEISIWNQVDTRLQAFLPKGR